MADFYQNGVTTTLHNLNTRTLEQLEGALVDFSRFRPMGLLLPSLYSELEGEALPHIVSQLKGVPYLNEIVIGLDRANLDQYKAALRFFGEESSTACSKTRWGSIPLSVRNFNKRR